MNPPGPVDPELETSPERPLDPNAYAWPEARLDPVARMRALASGLPHVAVAETIFETDFESLWGFVADLETQTPRFEGAVSRIRILEQAGDHIVLESKGPVAALSPWIRFEVVLRPGWCLMQSRFGRVGMAARPEGPGRTRMLHFEGSTRAGRLTRPLFARNIRGDFRRLSRLLGA